MNELSNQVSSSLEDDLDARLAEIASGDSFVQKMEKKQKVKPKIDDLSFEAEIGKYWWMYFLLLISALFTGTLGVFLGLAPYMTDTGLYFQTDGFHIFLSIAYCLAFITVTEFAFGLGKWLYYTRERKNASQAVSMIVWMIVAGVSILFTGIAGGSVLASYIAFMTEFAEVNVGSQQWIVKSIPALFVFYTVLGTFYALASRENRAKRMVREQQRDNELSHQTRLQVTKQWGQEQVQKADLMRYIRAVEQGLMTYQEAQDGIVAGRSLRETEELLRRDLDGDGKVAQRTNHHKKVYAHDEPDFPKPR
jgi:hypothetical protein